MASLDDSAAVESVHIDMFLDTAKAIHLIVLGYGCVATNDLKSWSGKGDGVVCFPEPSMDFPRRSSVCT